MATVKVRLADNINRVIMLNPKATVGSTIGTDLKMADGSVATVAKLQALLGIDVIITNTTGPITHRSLTGLTLGDDHPQYARKDTLMIDRVQTLAEVTVPANASAIVEDYYQVGAGLILTLAAGALFQIGTNPIVQPPILNYVLNPVIAVDRETFITNPRVPANSSVVVDGYYKLNTGVALLLEDNAVMHIGADGTVFTPSGSGGVNFSPLTTKGDIYVYSSINDRLPVGADGLVLSADSTQATGLKWVSPPAGTPGVPTALVGLAAVNGAAVTYMRSDAAPALDQSISPTWTGAHTFNGTVTFNTSITGPVVSVDRKTAVLNPTIPANASCIVDEYYQLGAGVALTLNAGSTLHIGVDGRQLFYTDVAGLAVVAHTGAYADLSGLPTIPVSANPATQIGLAVVNGIAATFMRSDAAPSLDQSISPTWTGTHTHNGPVVFNTSITGPVVSVDRQTAVTNPTIPANASCIVDEYYQLGAGVTLTLNAGSTMHIGVDGQQISYGAISGVPTIPTGANPTALVGLAAVNGAAVTFMRSDAAPPLDQSISPTWTGTHTHNGPVVFNVSVTSPATSTDRQTAVLSTIIPANASCIVDEYYQLGAGVALTLSAGATLHIGVDGVPIDPATSFTWSGRHLYTLSAAAGNLTYPVLFKSEGPGFGFQETDAPADQGWWDVMVNASSFRIRAFKDNGTAVRNILQATRTGSEIADLQLGNATSNNTFSFLGTGAITSSGNVTLTPTTGVALTVTGIAAGQVAIDVQHGIKAPAFAVDRQPNDDIVVPANGVSIVEEYQQLATGKSLTLNSGATLFLGIVAVAQPQPQTFTNQYSQALSVKDRAPFLSPIMQPNTSCTVESDYTLNPGIALTLMGNAILAIRS